MSVLVLRS